MICPCPQCYKPTFIEISPLVPEKTSLKGLNIAGHCVHLGHVVSMTLIFMYLKAHIQYLVKNGPVVSEKSKFEFSYVNDLGPRSRNDVDLQY